MPEISLYAELLIHIRQLTLYASLENARNEHTQILVSSDKKIVTVLHEGETVGIYLPTQISGTADITFPLDRRTEVSTKLHIEDQSELEQAIEAAPGVEVPWSASDLCPESSVSCTSCNATILEAGAITQWKDLPNENWAELMDLWFCHKPHEHNHEDTTNPAEAKGFSANSKLAVTSGTGLVDTLSFLIYSADCINIKVCSTPMLSCTINVRILRAKRKRSATRSEYSMARSLIHLPNMKTQRTVSEASTSSLRWMTFAGLAQALCTPLQYHYCYLMHTASKDQCRGQSANIAQVSPRNTDSTTEDLLCESCDAFIGSQSQSREGYRLWKSRLAIRASSGSNLESFDASLFIVAQLLHLIDTSISRRIVIHSSDNSDGLLTWIFNPDIYYTSSKRSPTAHRAAKVLYKPISDPNSLLDSLSNTHEELALPARELQGLKAALESSTSILPLSARTFQDFQVGLLDRYERKPSGVGVMDQNALNHQAPEKMDLFKKNLPEGWEGLFS